MSPEPKNSMTKGIGEAEPKANFAAAPVLLIGLFALLFFWGLVYLGDHGGGFNAQVYQPYSSFDDLKASQPKSAGGESIARGKIVYQTCAQCHQANGLGSAAVGCPPLAGSDWVQAEGPNRIISIVMDGLTGPIDVAGGHYGTGTMTAFKDVFSDQQVADVLTYIRQEWGNKAGPVTLEQVKAVRAQVAGRPGNETAAELLQMPVK